MSFLIKKILQIFDVLFQVMGNKFPEAKKHLNKAKECILLEIKNIKKDENKKILQKRQERDLKTKEWVQNLKNKKFNSENL